jgi:hypothetical protein
MKRTITMLLLLSALAGAVGLAGPAPVLAQAPPPTSFKAFAGSFGLSGFDFFVSGLARMGPTEPPIAPVDTHTLHTWLLNGVLSVNGDVSVFMAAANYRGTMPTLGVPFEFDVPYLVVATRVMQNGPPPIRVFTLFLRYNVTLIADGSLTINNVQVLGGSLPE